MAGVAKLFSYGLARILLAIALVAILPLRAPGADRTVFGQDRWPASPRWVSLGLSLQMAFGAGIDSVVPVDDAIRQKEFAAGRLEGMAVKAGDLSSLLQRAEQRRERIWATRGFIRGASVLPRHPTFRLRVGWEGWAWLNDSPLIATIAPRARKTAEHSRRWHIYTSCPVAPNKNFKLVWDALQRGRVPSSRPFWIRDDAAAFAGAARIGGCGATLCDWTHGAPDARHPSQCLCRAGRRSGNASP